MNNPYLELLSALTGPADDWREEAMCRDTDPDIFFPEGHNERENRQKVQAAKAICGTCPVQIQCLEWATSNGQRWGVWGGRNLGAGRAHHGERTHCKNLHEFTPENTTMVTRTDGYQFRQCNTCYVEKVERTNEARRKRTAERRGVMA
jgi:WhiB family redox-sensing transcriptional regulator